METRPIRALSAVASLSVALSAFTVVRAADNVGAAASTPPAIHVAHDGLKKLTWQLAVPTGTFTGKTVFETIELLHGLDIHHLELTPGQPLSADMPKAIVGQAMSSEAVAALLAKLKSVHMDIVSFGPVDLGPDDASARAVFAFGKKIKAKDIVAAPPADALERLDKLANEYGINLAVGGDTNASPYAKPEDLAAALGKSAHVGSDDDLTQWNLAGVDPLAATRVLHEHIVQIRIGANPPADLETILAELKKQGFKGVVAVACPPGSGEAEVDQFINTVNTLSDAVTKVAADQ